MKNFLRIGNSANEHYLIFYSDVNKLFYDAAQYDCFSDCSDEYVEEIQVNGHKILYRGWQPDMLYEYYDTVTNKVVFSQSFPHWDH